MGQSLFVVEKGGKKEYTDAEDCRCWVLTRLLLGESPGTKCGRQVAAQWLCTHLEQVFFCERLADERFDNLWAEVQAVAVHAL